MSAYLQSIEHWKTIDLTQTSDDKLLTGVRELAIADAKHWFSVSIMVGGAKATDGLLHRFLTSRLVPGNLNSGMFLRGFSSMTMAAQVDLEEIARRIDEDSSLRDLVCNGPADLLMETLASQPSREFLLGEIRRYLEKYGGQVYNLDFVEPTQIEDPTGHSDRIEDRLTESSL